MMPDIDKRLLAAAVVILLVGFFGGVKYADFKGKKEQARLTLNEATAQQVEKKETSTIREIKVYITGEVSKPGVYSLREGDRVYQAVEMAGGLLPDAEDKGVNMAASLKDGDPVVIPKRGEALPTSTIPIASPSPLNKSGKVNINTASVQELDGLKGIGPAIAQRIVDYREAHGSFKSLDELKKVSGIGEKKFADVKDSICL